MTAPAEKKRLIQTEILLSPVVDPNTITLEEVFTKASGSAAGFHAVSGWLTCPEQSRLYALGVRQRESFGGGEGRWSALDLGTVAHELRAIRVMFDHDTMERTLERWRADMHPDDYSMLLLLFRTYELTYPLAVDRERFDVLGVECEVVTNIGTKGAPIFRTVRYDTVIKVRGSGEVFSFEAKTMARSGTGALNPYKAQAMTQCVVWNRNEALVEKYGAMRGVLFDCLVKTKVPTVDRDGPRYFGKVHEKMTLDYLRLPENGGVVFSVQPDGTFPKMLHACWGRWRPCDYVNLCHENSVGEYQLRDGTPLTDVPFSLSAD